MQRSSAREQRSSSRVQRSSVRVQRSSLRVQRSSARVQCSSVRVQRSSARLQRSSTRVQRSSVRVQRSSFRVHRSSVGSALGCCMACPSSNLGSAPQEVFPSVTSNEEMEIGLGEWRCMNVLYECDYKCMKLKMIK